MSSLSKASCSRERAAALIIVLAFVVLLTGLVLAYFSRTTGDRQVAHASFNQSKADLLAQSAMDNIIGDLRQEIANGSANLVAPGVTPTVTPAYRPIALAYMVPQRFGTSNSMPNLIRRSVSTDSAIPPPGLPSKASAVNSTNNPSANGRFVSLQSWNKHYLIPRDPSVSDPSVTTPISAFTAPDWIFVTSDPANTTAGRRVITSPDPLIIGRYAYAVYDEGGLVDMNVAGYPSPTTILQYGRKGSLAFANLTALPNPAPSPFTPTQVDNIVGWRNYASAQPSGSPYSMNFTFNATSATNYYNYVVANNTGFLTVNSTATPSPATLSSRTDQTFVTRQQLISFRTSVGFSADALQYLTTFSRETNSPSFSPANPTAVNPNFLLARVTTSFTRFDGTTAVVGEPLVKTRFPLSRLAWITYKGPSALRTPLPPQTPALPPTDPNYDMWALQWLYGVPASYLLAGTAANIQKCFGLTFANPGTAGDPWTYTNPAGGGAVNTIMTLDQVAAARREPDLFELLKASISNGSLGQYTNTGGAAGGVTGQNTGGAGLVFPDVHMSSKMQHILTIGACMIDQADPGSIPTRIQFTGTNGNTWTAYGVENLPYITQLYPIAGVSPDAPTKWATYLLFQLWDPHQTAASGTPLVRLRVDGGVGLFAGGNSETWNTSNTAFINATGQSVIVTPASFSTPAPLSTSNTTNAAFPPGPPAGGVFAALSPPLVTPTPTP